MTPKLNNISEEWFIRKAEEYRRRQEEARREEARREEAEARRREAERLAKANKPKDNPEAPKQEPTTTQATLPNKDGFIYVPSINLYLSEETHFKGKRWNQSHIETQKQGYTMPTISQFVEFLKYLRSDEGQSNVKNARIILNEIYEVRSPWRAEWLDALFEKQDDKMLIHYNHRINGTNLIAQNTEQLIDYLAETKTPGISLDNWLANSNKHGLPKSNCKKGNLYYWKPTNGNVARFDASSVRANFGCDWDPDDRDVSLGVRFVASL